ncbi:MAG TPA: glycosyltransferase family A protein [Solirubrobacteraceae bacterium]|nr:glycosyltransferase family A protein [Solirubrobacteraceae bacterium]
MRCSSWRTCSSARLGADRQGAALPRVSVIVPAHDAADHLPAAIASVRAQTFGDWEIVAVDDGSSDGTWELLSKAGPRVTALRRESAGGPARARNLALARAGGELVVFLDADDLLLPRYLERQIERYEAATRGPGAPVGLVGCDALILGAGGYAAHTHVQRVPGGRRALTLERLLRLNPLHVSCLVPAAVGEQVGWFDPELFGTEDYGLWIAILERGYRAVLSEEVLAVYRRVPGAVSSNLARQARNNRRAYERALGRGHLRARQRRLARRSIRYNRALEQVALARFSATGARRPGAGWLRQAPALLEAALRNPRRWPAWLRLLYSGRAEDAAELRASP